MTVEKKSTRSIRLKGRKKGRRSLPEASKWTVLSVNQRQTAVQGDGSGVREVIVFVYIAHFLSPSVDNDSSSELIVRDPVAGRAKVEHLRKLAI